VVSSRCSLSGARSWPTRNSCCWTNHPWASLRCLSPLLVETIFKTIRDIRDQGATILLVEQNAALALEVADRAYVLESGVISLSGTGAELARDDKVRRSYLGEL
jgi:ABC-type branched-subunit amino acid transport system ATPase component